MTHRKTTIILLIIIAVVLIGGGYWLYITFKPVATVSTEIEEDIKLIHVYKAKDVAIKNIEDFLKTPNYQESILENFYDSAQFTSLKKVDIDISLDYIGNPEPFYSFDDEE